VVHSGQPSASQVFSITDVSAYVFNGIQASNIDLIIGIGDIRKNNLTSVFAPLFSDNAINPLGLEQETVAATTTTVQNPNGQTNGDDISVSVKETDQSFTVPAIPSMTSASNGNIVTTQHVTPNSNMDGIAHTATNLTTAPSSMYMDAVERDDDYIEATAQ
jgi:hypothetical protein